GSSAKDPFYGRPGLVPSHTGKYMPLQDHRDKWVAKEVVRVLAGQMPRDPVNPEVLKLDECAEGCTRKMLWCRLGERSGSCETSTRADPSHSRQHSWQ